MDVDKQLRQPAASGAAMSYEFDGLVFFSRDPAELSAAVRAARMASDRELEVKPYPKDFGEWLASARAKHPRDQWDTPSRFSWPSVR